jgi:hypothetical protein
MATKGLPLSLALVSVLLAAASSNPLLAAPNSVAATGPAHVQPGDDAVLVVLAPDGLADARSFRLFPNLPSGPGLPDPPLWLVTASASPQARAMLSTYIDGNSTSQLGAPVTVDGPFVLAYVVVHVSASVQPGTPLVVTMHYALLDSRADDQGSSLDWGRAGQWPLPDGTAGVLSSGDLTVAMEAGPDPGPPPGLDSTVSVASFRASPDALIPVPVMLGSYIRQHASYGFVRITTVPTRDGLLSLPVTGLSRPMLSGSIASMITDAVTDPLPGIASATLELAAATTFWPLDTITTAALQPPPSSPGATYRIHLSAGFVAQDGSLLRCEVKDGTVTIGPSGGPTQEPPLVYGDLNGDGRVTMADCDLALRFLLGLQMITPQQAKAADVWPATPDGRGDGRISLEDIREMLLRAVGVWR